MVHRKNKELSAVCSNLSPGQTRAVQKKNSKGRLASDRAAATSAANDEDPDYQLHKKMRLSHAHMAIIKSQSDVVSLQLKLFSDNKDTFVESHGIAEYNKKIVGLLGKLPDPVVNLLSATAVDGDGNGDEGLVVDEAEA